MDELSLFSGNANRALASSICQHLGLHDGRADVFQFSNENIFVKIDENIGDKHHISGYYNQSYRNRNNNGSSRYLPVPGLPTSSWQQQTTPGNMVRLSLNSTITPTILNRVAAGYNRFVNDNGALPYTVGKDLAGQIGIENTSPNMFPTFSFNNDGAKDYQGKDIGRMGVGFVDHSSNGSYIYQDDLTWIHGKHSFRVGYEYARYYYNDNGQSDSGSFSFSPKQTDLPGFITDTGHSFASFMLGAVSKAGHGINALGNSGFRAPYHAFYASDDWKITPKLTMNLGLRWEVIPPFYEVTGRMSEVDLNVANPDAGNRPEEGGIPGSLLTAGIGLLAIGLAMMIYYTARTHRLQREIPAALVHSGDLLAEASASMAQAAGALDALREQAPAEVWEGLAASLALSPEHLQALRGQLERIRSQSREEYRQWKEAEDDLRLWSRSFENQTALFADIGTTWAQVQEARDTALVLFAQLPAPLSEMESRMAAADAGERNGKLLTAARETFSKAGELREHPPVNWLLVCDLLVDAQTCLQKLSVLLDPEADDKARRNAIVSPRPPRYWPVGAASSPAGEELAALTAVWNTHGVVYYPAATGGADSSARS